LCQKKNKERIVLFLMILKHQRDRQKGRIEEGLLPSGGRVFLQLAAQKYSGRESLSQWYFTDLPDLRDADRAYAAPEHLILNSEPKRSSRDPNPLTSKQA
jgi:hypothetical protein